mmetsp:Transcript_6108/g.12392  ORF Transcript_6108/g.12392 Transcript_6108/m.12392 type:complete len:216 (+) Transcript_6108:3-650(+)
MDKTARPLKKSAVGRATCARPPAASQELPALDFTIPRCASEGRGLQLLPQPFGYLVEDTQDATPLRGSVQVLLEGLQGRHRQRSNCCECHLRRCKNLGRVGLVHDVHADALIVLLQGDPIAAKDLPELQEKRGILGEGHVGIAVVERCPAPVCIGEAVAVEDFLQRLLVVGPIAPGDGVGESANALLNVVVVPGRKRETLQVFPLHLSDHCLDVV